jgi:hypothetical protein
MKNLSKTKLYCMVTAKNSRPNYEFASSIGSDSYHPARGKL